MQINNTQTGLNNQQHIKTFNGLLRHPARKWSGCILQPPSPHMAPIERIIKYPTTPEMRRYTTL